MFKSYIDYEIHAFVFSKCSCTAKNLNITEKEKLTEVRKDKRTAIKKKIEQQTLQFVCFLSVLNFQVLPKIK